MKKILIVENNDSVRNALIDLLERQDYYVYSAESVEKAEDQLKRIWPHLAIIDARLRNDNDPEDDSGIRLATKMDSEIAKIILTGDRSPKSFKQAMELYKNKGSAAIPCIIDKRDGPTNVLGYIASAFENMNAKINWSLEFVHPQGWDFETAAEKLSRSAKEYVFSWNKIPGKDDERLLEFLAEKFDVNWIKNAGLDKIDSGKTIKVNTEKNSLSLKLNDKKTEVILEIDDGRTDKFIAKMEADKLNIYAKNENISGDELKDLFKRLFHWANKITINPISPGFSSAGVLNIVTDYKEGKGLGADVIVKFGTRESIEKEEMAFNNYVKMYMGGMRSAFILDSAYTAHTGGIIYSLIGLQTNIKRNLFLRALSFEDYYKKETSMEIKKVIKELFNDTLNHWFINSGLSDTRNLADEYIKELWWSKPEENYQEHLLGCYNDCFKNEAKFREKYRATFSELLNWINQMHDQFHLKMIWHCTTHGDLHARNVIIVDGKTPWIIDFYYTKIGYVLRDLIRLETSVKFDLFREDKEASFIELEDALQNYCGISEKPKGKRGELPESIKGKHELEKAFISIQTIREEAFQIISGKNLRIDLSYGDVMFQYYIGLLFQTLRFLKWHEHRSVENEKHIILSAVRIQSELDQWIKGRTT